MGDGPAPEGPRRLRQEPMEELVMPGFNFGLTPLHSPEDDELERLIDEDEQASAAQTTPDENTEPRPSFAAPTAPSSRPTPRGAEALSRAHDRDNFFSIGQEAVNNITN